MKARWATTLNTMGGPLSPSNILEGGEKLIGDENGGAHCASIGMFQLLSSSYYKI